MTSFAPLTSVQLNSFLDNDPHFIGVYPRDLLPTSSTLRYCRPLTLIINTDTSNLDGRHWVAVYIDRSGYGEYFDSLAQPIPDHISLWLSRNSSQWKYVLRPFIDSPIQSITSQTCGAFAYFYVHERPLVDSCRRILVPFRSLTYNDKFVISYLNKNAAS